MSKQDFINSILPGAIKSYKQYSIFPSLTIAQAILESNWGKSCPGNMLFGIKWAEGCGYDKQLLWTHEYVDGKYIRVQAYFRKYDSMADSIYDHAEFLAGKSRYKQVLEAKDYKEACKAIQEAGYATDPSYANKLISIIEQNKLYQYDTTTTSIPISSNTTTKKEEPEMWKQKIIQEAFDLGLITDKAWIDKADETATIWFVVAIAVNLFKKLKS